MLALENRIIEMLTLHTNPHAIQGRSTLKDECERQFWNGPFRELKARINDVVHKQSMSPIYEQIMIPTDDTMTKDLIASIVLKRTTQLLMNVR